MEIDLFEKLGAVDKTRKYNVDAVDAGRGHFGGVENGIDLFLRIGVNVYLGCDGDMWMES